MNPANAETAGRSFFRWPESTGIAFPLLTRELIEQSARKRTFALRTLYAAGMYGFMLWTFWNELGGWSNQSFNSLGHGSRIFLMLAWIQFGGIYLFLPAMTSGVLTVEKERDTLSLLLLTRLGPWSILLGKLLSRLIAMASYLLLSLPLLAVAYSLGGVESQNILVLAWSLMVTSVQVGSLALACSAWFRTTATAFVATYVIGVMVIFGPVFLTNGGQNDVFGIFDFLQLYGHGFGLWEYTPYEFVDVIGSGFGPFLCLTPRNQGSTLVQAVGRSVPMMAFSGACLLFARIVLWRRAFVQATNPLLNLFRSLDKFFHRMNQNRLTRGIVVIRENVALPRFDPISWRETKKRSLGTTRYLVRTLLLLEFLLLFGMVFQTNPNSYAGERYSGPVFVAAWVLWAAATLIIVVQSTGLIGMEKSRQTLDVLLTIPMTSRRIVQEKFAGVWRMIRMLWIPFATVYGFQTWWLLTVFHDVSGDQVALTIIRGLLATLIYPPLIALIGFYAGLRCKSQTQAVLVALGGIAFVCAVPILAVSIYFDGMVLKSAMSEAVLWLSPVVVITITADSAMHANPLIGILYHFAAYGACLAWLRNASISTFSARVGRTERQFEFDEEFDSEENDDSEARGQPSFF